jgi:subtilisin-like proprotein convertase family protein
LSFTNSTAVPIRDYRNTISTIVVGQSFKVADLNVSVNLNHTYVGDLIITLKSPTNKVVTLFKRRGGDGQNLVNTVFDDESTALLQNSTAPFTGSFKPETVLSAFDGSMAKGTWTLTVSDRAWYDTGTFNSWQMDFIPAQAAASQRAPSSKSALRSIEITDATLASFSTTTPNSTSFANGSGITPRPIEASVQLVTEVVARAPAQTTAHASTPRRLARANSWADHALWSRF